MAGLTFSQTHAEVLTNLIQNQQLSPEQAMLAINDKDKNKAQEVLNTYKPSSSNQP